MLFPQQAMMQQRTTRPQAPAIKPMSNGDMSQLPVQKPAHSPPLVLHVNHGE